VKKGFLRYSYKSEIIINSATEEIWQVLTDLESYAKWNPFTVKVRSEWIPGKPVHLTVKMKPNRRPITQTEYLSRIQQPEILAWGFSYGWILKAMRTQQLIRIHETQTQYVNEDIIEGLLSPIVHAIYGKWIQKGFDEISVALKNYMKNHVIEK
jgi:hypothetical protein